jgi:hypothetical protein
MRTALEFHLEAFTVGRDGESIRRITIDSTGFVTDTVGSTWIIVQHGHELISTSRLTKEQLDSLIGALERAHFFALPEDLSEPPFFPDQAMDALEVQLGTRKHLVRASGIEFSTTAVAVAFRELVHYVLSLSREPAV